MPSLLVYSHGKSHDAVCCARKLKEVCPTKAATTVKENHIFRRAYRKGRTAVRSGLVVYCLPNRRGNCRLGITASTKLGKAVVRSFVRRRIRSLWQNHKREMVGGYDVIIVARSRMVSDKFAKLEKQYVSALQELELLREETV